MRLGKPQTRRLHRCIYHTFPWCNLYVPINHYGKFWAVLILKIKGYLSNRHSILSPKEGFFAIKEKPPFLYLGERIECLLERYPFILSIRTAQNFPQWFIGTVLQSTIDKLVNGIYGSKEQLTRAQHSILTSGIDAALVIDTASIPLVKTLKMVISQQALREFPPKLVCLKYTYEVLIQLDHIVAIHYSQDGSQTKVGGKFQIFVHTIHVN